MNTNNSIKNNILTKIEQGDIKKISKFYFITKSVLYVLVFIIIPAYVLFLLSFIFYILQSSEILYLPIFGIKGIELLFGNFPWFLIFLAVLLLVILELLVSQFPFVYRKPLLYSTLSMIIVVVMVSILIRQTSIHENIYESIKKDNSKYTKIFYDKYANSSIADFHPGTVLEITEDGFILENRDKTTILVKIIPTTRMGKNFKIYKGGRLLILGKIQDGIIMAESIDNAPREARPSDK